MPIAGVRISPGGSSTEKGPGPATRLQFGASGAPAASSRRAAATGGGETRSTTGGALQPASRSVAVSGGVSCVSMSVCDLKVR
jgi:hypothetical protein